MGVDSMSEGNDSSPTKYFPRDQGPDNRSVSFAVPTGTFLTMQDRVGTGVGERKPLTKMYMP